MQFFTRNRTQHTMRSGSRLALAVAMATTAVVGMVAVETPAYAAKKDKKSDSGKANYSKGFIDAYKPVETLTKADTKDAAAISAALPAMIAAIETPDDRFVAGQVVYGAGRDTSNRALQRQGIDLMIESGKVPADASANYIFMAGQLAYQDEDWATSRSRILQAIDAGYVENNPEGIVAETYFNQNLPVDGLKYLAKVINDKIAAGQPIDENWLKRGISIAYTNDLNDAAVSFANMLARYYPSPTSWGDAIAIQRNFYEFDSQQMLDLLRLADRTGSMRNERDYVEYIESADARRLPGEVTRIVKQGLDTGYLKTSDVFVGEVKSIAAARLKADQDDLPSLESDARKAGSTAVTATAAGDAFLSYGKAAQAEEMYTIALSKAGVDTPRVQNRLGIAQIDQGKIAEAKASFAKVTGPRKSIAALWSVYADQKAKAVATTAEPATAM